MAGAEKLIEKILGDAQAEAEKLWHEAEEKKQAMHEELMRDLEKHKAAIEKDAAAAAEERRRRMAAVYDLEYRKQLLSAKQDMMQQAKVLAQNKLRALSDADYLRLMKQRLLACAPSGEGSIAVSKDEKWLNDAFLAGVNSELKSKAGKGSLTFSSEKRDILGGFVYINGGMEIDVSLEALLDETWTDCETDVAKILFE